MTPQALVKRLRTDEPLTALLTQVEGLERNFCETHFLPGLDVPLPEVQRAHQNAAVEQSFDKWRVLMRSVRTTGVQAVLCSDNKNELPAGKRDFLLAADFDIVESAEWLPRINRNGHIESPLG